MCHNVDPAKSQPCKRKRIQEVYKFAHVFSVGSFSLCAVSLVLQILEIENRFVQRDFAAIEDTIGAVIFAAVALVAVTMVLNVIAVIQKRSERGN